METTSLPLMLIVDEADSGECGLFLWAGGLSEADLQCWAGDSPATGSEQNVGPQVRTEGEDDSACTPTCASRPTDPVLLPCEEAGSWVERGGLFLLRCKKMTPVEGMSFPKVTQLVGNRFFFWALEAIGMHRKAMVLELARPPPTCYLCDLCVGLRIYTVGFIFLPQGLLGRVTVDLTHV